MQAVIVVLGLLMMMVTLVLHRRVKVFSLSIPGFVIIAVLMAVLLLIIDSDVQSTIQQSFFGQIHQQPLRILGLFFSFSFVSIALDETGWLKALAYRFTQHVHDDQKTLVTIVYALASVLTIFTANDIVILTLTPFIVYLTKRLNINPLPYVMSILIAANTWSMLFIIGNPTNIYLANYFQISFLSYAGVMVIPTILTGIGGWLLIQALFYRVLKLPINFDEEVLVIEVDKEAKSVLMTLILMILLMVIAPWMGLTMDVVAIIMTTLLIGYGVIIWKKKSILLKSFLRLPFEIIPFFMSMVIVVQTINQLSFITELWSIVVYVPNVILYGVGSTLIANVINNIPMSLWIAQVIEGQTIFSYLSVYAAIIGSNIGALLTPLGALAGLLWMHVLQSSGVKFSLTQFIRYGIFITPILLTIALWSMSLIFLLI
jgi:arsenical pump membrane protein